MMSKYQIYLFISDAAFSEVRFTSASYNRDCNSTILMTVSAFHKTRFGSFREIPDENPRPPPSARLRKYFQSLHLYNYSESREPDYSSTSVADVNEEFPQMNFENSSQYVPMSILKDLLTSSQLRIIERLGYRT